MARQSSCRGQAIPAGGGNTCLECGRAFATVYGEILQCCEYCLLGAVLEPVGPLPADLKEETPASTEGWKSLGPFTLMEEIGRGGMGVIYRAVHHETREVVAVKTVLPQSAGCAETLARFQREAQAARSLDHPHCMPILDVGTSEDGVPFFSMQLAAGGSLYHLIAKYRGRWRQTAELMEKISRAVHHAHCQGVLHRDIKPGNILFTEDYEPLITDFGLAKQLTVSDDLTRSHAVLGTPNYVAPEQAAGKTRELTVAADIYSLGAVLFELLTGRPPFVGDNPLDVLHQIGKKSPPRPRQLVPAVPEPLDNICMRCLERHPEDRYASAQDLARDLERWLDGCKISPRPSYPKARNAIRRQSRLGVWCSAIIILAASVWIGWSTTTRRTHPAEPTTTILVAVESLEQNPAFGQLAGQVTSELRGAVSKTQIFQLKGEGIDPTHLAEDGFDPLAYGRANSVQMVLTGCVRRLNGEARLVMRLLRCDTGAVVWQHCDQMPFDQAAKNLPGLVEAIMKDLRAAWHVGSNQSVAASQDSSRSNAQALYARAAEIAARRTHADLNTAATLLKKACEADPTFAPARAMLAFTLWTLANSFGEHEQMEPTVQAAREALALDQNSAQAHRVIAACLLDEAQYTAALEEFWRTLELNPQSAGCCQSLGICLRRMGRPGESIRWFKRAVKLEPARGEVVGCLGEAYFLCGRDDLAEPALRRAIELDGDTPNALVDFGALRTWQKRFGEAREFCEQIRHRFPDNRWALTLAAWIEFSDGKAAEAEKYYQQLRAENSYQQNWMFYGSVNPSSALACLAQRADDTERARSLAEEATKIDLDLLAKNPRNPRILHDLAATRCVSGDIEGALDYLQRTVSAGWVEQRSTQLDPRFSHIASLPRYQELLASMARNFEE